MVMDPFPRGGRSERTGHALVFLLGDDALFADKAIQTPYRRWGVGGEERGPGRQIESPASEIKGACTVLGHIPKYRAHVRFVSRAAPLDIDQLGVIITRGKRPPIA